MHTQKIYSRPTGGRMLLQWSFCFALAFAWLGLNAQSNPSREYQVKAVFLYNFTQFVQWPQGGSRGPFIIGILGNDPFGAYLDQTVANERVAGRSIVVRRFREAGDVGACHILFVHAAQATPGTLAALKNRGVLTVGDAGNFISRGGMVRFYTENNKIRLQINLAAAKEADLEISSKLLRVADVVE
ncbi:YfiR family protein [Paraflavisolibacter sp. H34]|uniref:YfiR family protein n=1 Tax=Huijunlia imazamoxiresistens TaxID=3127457 RepID=UPI003019516D